MSKIITFSTHFQKSHPKAGEPTYFVEQILDALKIDYLSEKYLSDLCFWNTKNLANGKLSYGDLKYFRDRLTGQEHGFKWHTIRNGSRFKVGEMFQPVVWSRTPYNSPQIKFAPEIKVERTFKFVFEGNWFLLGGSILNSQEEKEVAKNDGLKLQDFKDWFSKEFLGQGICWTDELGY